MNAIALGYNKITVESPKLDDNGEPILKKGKPVADTSKRDTETIPLDEDINAYFAREVLPFRPSAWIDKSKTKVGYEIPFTKTFYEYKELEPADEIAKRIEAHERSLMEKLRMLFGKVDEETSIFYNIFPKPPPLLFHQKLAKSTKYLLCLPYIDPVLFTK